ncbi:hypothetical protein BN1221_04455c [Brenneria goodwinii]|uniref:Uncharacterized protein n=1 Tax=Brenneria goodwinii TaxID=1109412 RepID=A0A0G4K1F9_9GAMM|nr:hypothetical protein BN1221_04455c [Brenneria goodwinii]
MSNFQKSNPLSETVKFFSSRHMHHALCAWLQARFFVLSSKTSKEFGAMDGFTG